MEKPKLLVFASGTATGGGLGFENLATSSDLEADIVAVVSNHEHGGVRARAERLGIPFVYFPGPYDAEHYASVLQKTGITNPWVALSGWLKLVKGLDPARTFNIHPALLSHLGGRFGGKGMYGRALHEAVKAAFDAGPVRGKSRRSVGTGVQKGRASNGAGEITESGFTMHFVTDEYDRGPAFFEHRVPLTPGMTADDIVAAVNKAEHQWQPKITNMVVHGQIRWDGKDPKSLVVPEGITVPPYHLRVV